MSKRVSELQKKKISESFINGVEINEISNLYNFSKQTIIKQLKRILGDEKFNNINNKRLNRTRKGKEFINEISKEDDLVKKKTFTNDRYNSSFEKETKDETFFEIPPITTEIDLDNQKDLTSKYLGEVNLPSVVYMLVEKNIELEPKLLKDFPEWSFLSESDLNRKTIQIFSDQKLGKQSCSQNQKLIKVPNTNVFLIASAKLKSRGISRIIFEDSLLSL